MWGCHGNMAIWSKGLTMKINECVHLFEILKILRFIEESKTLDKQSGFLYELRIAKWLSIQVEDIHNSCLKSVYTMRIIK